MIYFTNEELDIIRDALGWLLDQTNDEDDGKYGRWKHARDMQAGIKQYQEDILK